jgi:DNA-binding GntR family transcriptional regulator
VDFAAGNIEPPTDEGDIVRKKSLKEAVFEYLHRRIVAGKYPPGEWLRQEDISTQLGVSQTPVREALDLLVSVGLAERVPYRGVKVPELTAETITDAYVLRLLLEGTAARLAAENISAEKLQALAQVVARTKTLVTLDDMSTQRQLNKLFHLSIAEASGNALLYKMCEMTSNLFPDWRLYEYMFRHPELLSSSLRREFQEHQSILDAIAAHAADQAALRVVEHIRNLSDELVNFLGIPADLIHEKEKQVTPLLPIKM